MTVLRIQDEWQPGHVSRSWLIRERGVTDKWSVVQGVTLVQPVAIYSFSPGIAGLLKAGAALGRMLWRCRLDACGLTNGRGKNCEVLVIVVAGLHALVGACGGSRRASGALDFARSIRPGL
ncbi:hypothetical protein EMIT0324P_50052 [Pseudomonas chlororaphis]